MSAPKYQDLRELSLHYSSFFCCSLWFSRGFTEHRKVSTTYNITTMIYNVTHHDLEFVFSCYTKKLLIRLSSVPGSKWFGQCANQILQESLLHLPTSFYCISRAHTEQVRLIVDFICMLSADSSRPLVHTMDGSALVKDSRATNCQSGRAQIIRITSNKDDRLGLLIFAGAVELSSLSYSLVLI